MSQELQLGKYEFFPYDEEIQRLLDELLLTDEEREKRYRMAKNEAEMFVKRHKRLKRIDKKSLKRLRWRVVYGQKRRDYDATSADYWAM